MSFKGGDTMDGHERSLQYIDSIFFDIPSI